jgi:capsular polysaccharide transport system permease protein
VSPFLLMTASVIPYMLVRHSFSSIPGSISKNMDLYGYPQVKPIDALLAHFILETGLTLLGGSALILGLYWFADMTPRFPDPLAVIGLFGLIIMLTLGISLTVGIYSTMSDTFERVLGFVTRPLIFVSLVFHLGTDLPDQVRYWASWNPLADVNELIRSYMLGIKPMPEATISYPALVAILTLAMGLIVYYANRFRILQQE